MEDEKSKEVSQEIADKKSGSSILKWVAIGCGGAILIFVILITIIFAVVLKVTSGPVKVVESQLEAIRANDIKKAYDFNSLQFKKSVPYKDFRQIVRHTAALKDNKSASFNNRKIKDGIATLRGTIKFKGGKIPAEYRLVKENGQWRILYLRLNPGSK